jgi:hypothetical protein
MVFLVSFLFAPSKIDKLVKPMGGKWTGEWTIDNTNEKLGKDGWEFASAWPKFAKRDARDWANPGDSVRRRKWVRTMKCTPASSASSSRKSKASPASSHEQRQRDIVRAIKILNGTNKDINSFMKRIGTEKDSSKDRAQFDEVFESTEKRLEEVEMELENLKADGGARMHGTGNPHLRIWGNDRTSMLAFLLLQPQLSKRTFVLRATIPSSALTPESLVKSNSPSWPFLGHVYHHHVATTGHYSRHSITTTTLCNSLQTEKRPRPC